MFHDSFITYVNEKVIEKYVVNNFKIIPNTFCGCSTSDYLVFNDLMHLVKFIWNYYLIYLQ